MSGADVEAIDTSAEGTRQGHQYGKHFPYLHRSAFPAASTQVKFSAKRKREADQQLATPKARGVPISTCQVPLKKKKKKSSSSSHCRLPRLSLRAGLASDRNALGVMRLSQET
eukprot:775349-Prymnesium_polylepis.1